MQGIRRRFGWFIMRDPLWSEKMEGEFKDIFMELQGLFSISVERETRREQNFARWLDLKYSRLWKKNMSDREQAQHKIEFYNRKK